MQRCDVAIVGAGPYGLAAAAQLKQIKGLEIRIFGETMGFWEHHMPVGMFLRSPWEATHIADPCRSLTLDAYGAARGNQLTTPVPIERFIDYGHWFQQQIALDVDRRKVIQIDRAPAGFQIRLEDGDEFCARRVVVASGIVPFAYRPPQFAKLPASLASHSCDHRDLRKFAGQRIAVIGAGQSALESAALLHEAGAQVEVIVRAPGVHWLWQRPWLHKWPISTLLYAWPDVGPAGVSHIVARPNLFRRLPRSVQDRLAPRSIRPAGASWLKPRVDGVPITTGCKVISAALAGEEVEISLDDASKHRVDHVLLATGYRVNIALYSFLSRGVLDSIDRFDGYPKLNPRFESSAPGLHFLGAPAAWSFGPLMRFVAGTWFAARGLARAFPHQPKADRSH